MIAKEIRALLPVWAVGAAALLASGLGIYPLQFLGVPIYFFALASLGSLSVGHEYTNGTIGSFLMLPVPRWRLWTVKQLVVLPMIATLGIAAPGLVTLGSGDRTFGAALFWAPVLAALFIAPWLTMVSRDPRFGIVFTIGIVGGAMALGDWIGAATYGFTADVDAFRVAFLWWTVGGLSLTGAVLGWRTFTRLEVTDRGSAGSWRTAAAAAGAPPRPRHPLVALVVKELRLQQLPLVVAASYAAGMLAIGLVWRRHPDIPNVLSLLTGLYWVLLPALVGSVASAEERHLGTRDAQLMLPVSSARQWIVKTAVALILAVALGLLLPALLATMLPIGWPGTLDAPRRVFSSRAVAIVLAGTAIGLYASTLARSGVNAALLTVAFFTGAWTLTSVTAINISAAAFTAAGGRGVPPPVLASGLAWIVLFVPLSVLAVAFALSNHRYADRPPGRLALHATLAAAWIVAGSAVIGVVNALRV